VSNRVEKTMARANLKTRGIIVSPEKPFMETIYDFRSEWNGNYSLFEGV